MDKGAAGVDVDVDGASKGKEVEGGDGKIDVGVG